MFLLGLLTCDLCAFEDGCTSMHCGAWVAI